MYDQGEILIVPFPFSNLESIKKRPVLVLSKNEDNISSDEIIVCGITSNLKDYRYSISIANQNLIKGSIPKISKVRPDKLFTISKEIIIKKVGRLNKETFLKVRKEFLNLI